MSCSWSRRTNSASPALERRLIEKCQRDSTDCALQLPVRWRHRVIASHSRQWNAGKAHSYLWYIAGVLWIWNRHDVSDILVYNKAGNNQRFMFHLYNWPNITPQDGALGLHYRCNNNNKKKVAEPKITQTPSTFLTLSQFIGYSLENCNNIWTNSRVKLFQNNFLIIIS